MNNPKNCKIARYDESITESPYLTIQIDTMFIDKPETDNLGEEFARRLIAGCRSLGYVFKFYTSTQDSDFDYEVVVE